MVQPTLSGNSHPPTSSRRFCFFLSALSRFLVAWFLVAPMDKDWCARVEGGRLNEGFNFFFKRRKSHFDGKKIPGYAELHTNLPNVFFGLPTFERDHQLHQLPSIRSLYPTAHYATMHPISTSSSGCVNNTLSTAFNGDVRWCPCMTQSLQKTVELFQSAKSDSHRTLGGDGEASRPTGRRWFANEFSQSNTHLGWANPVDRISCWISKTTAIPQTLQEKPREHLAKKDHPPVSRAYPDFSFSVNVTRESSNFSKKKELSALLIPKTPLKTTAKSGKHPKWHCTVTKNRMFVILREEKKLVFSNFLTSDSFSRHQSQILNPRSSEICPATDAPMHWEVKMLPVSTVFFLGEGIQDATRYHLKLEWAMYHSSLFMIHHSSLHDFL